MNGIAVLVTLAAVGVDYGWQPSSDGQLEYIIQIEPDLLDSLKNGAEIASAIHPDARGVRRFRIKVGSEPLPRNGSLQSGTTPTRLSAADATPAPSSRTLIGAPSASGQQDAASSGAGASPHSPGGAGLAAEFGADGLLNLPPPPALGADGKTSVLVRPGSRAAITSDQAGRPGLGPLPSLDRINPPAPPSTGPAQRDTAAGDGGRWEPPITAPAGNGFPADGGDGSSFPAPPLLGEPPGSNEGPAPPHDQRDVRPVPSPSNEYGPPAPIFGAGRGELLPPDATSVASEVLPPQWNVPEQSTEPSIDRSAAPPQKELLAAVADRGAALQKPTLGEKEAEDLKELERQAEPAKPWSTLVLTSMALFASLAANVYLGWVALGIYRRYRDVAGQLHRFQTSLT